MEEEIQLITEAAHKAISSADIEQGLDVLAATLAAHTEPSGIEADIGEITSSWSEEDLDRDQSRTDLAIAIALHKHLPISRMQAHDLRLWASLTLLIPGLRNYIEARWMKPGWAAENRVTGRGSRRRQALFRLWNAVEQTVDSDDEDPYRLTRALFAHRYSEQLIVDTVESRWAFRLRRILEGFVNHCESQGQEFIKKSAVKLTQAANSHDIERMGADEIADLLVQIAPVPES